MKQLLSVLYKWTKKVHLKNDQKVPLSFFFYQVCTCFITNRTEQNEITWGAEPVKLIILLVCKKQSIWWRTWLILKMAFKWTQIMSCRELTSFLYKSQGPFNMKFDKTGERCRKLEPIILATSSLFPFSTEATKAVRLM